MIAGAVWFDADECFASLRLWRMGLLRGFVMADLARLGTLLLRILKVALAVMVDSNPDFSGKWYESAHPNEIDCRNLCGSLGV